MNLDPLLGASQGNLPPEAGFGGYNAFSHSQNQQTLGSNTPTSYDESSSSGHLTRRNPMQNETAVTASHLAGDGIQGYVQESYHTPQTHAPLLDNNLPNDSGGMERGGNRTQMSENYNVDSGIPIDPRLHQTGPAGAPSQEQLLRRAKEAARSLSTGHGNNQQYGPPMPFSPAGPAPNCPGGIYHGQMQGMSLPHPSQVTPGSSGYQFPTQNVSITSLSPNNFPPGSMIPTTSPGNPLQAPLPTTPAFSGPVNALPNSLASVSHGGRLLKISRLPHRPYTEDDFKGIRIGGKRMTTKVRGEWDAETKANHYPFFLKYHGRPKYQASEDKHANFKKRSAAARALSPDDKVLLLDFIKANKYWCKHKKLPNPPNVQLVFEGSDGNESDAEDELPDPDETNGEEEEMSNSGIAQIIGPQQYVHASHDVKEFVNFQQLNTFLIRQNLPSLLDLANQHLERIGHPKVRLSKKSGPASSSSPSNSSAPGEMTQVASQNYGRPNTNFKIADNGVNNYGPTSNTASQHNLTHSMTPTAPDDSLLSVPQSVKSGKRKDVENELHSRVAEDSVPSAKKVRSSNAFMGQVANSNAQHQNHAASGELSASNSEYMNNLVATYGAEEVFKAYRASDVQNHPASRDNLAGDHQHVSAYAWESGETPAVGSPCPFQQDDATINSEGYFDHGPIGSLDKSVTDWEQAFMADPSRNDDSSY